MEMRSGLDYKEDSALLEESDGKDNLQLEEQVFIVAVYCHIDINNDTNVFNFYIFLLLV